jgi:hypothetical protein
MDLLLLKASDIRRWPDSMIHVYAQNIVKNAESKKKHHSKPQFKHDCSSCKYLGRYQHTDFAGRTWNYDLYYCGDNPSHNKVRATVIARFGNEGSQYQSGLNSGLPELEEAKKRAINKGYLKQNAAGQTWAPRVKEAPQQSPSATEIQSPRFKHEKTKGLTFLGWATNNTTWDLYVDKDNQIISVWNLDGEIDWAIATYGSWLWGKAQDYLNKIDAIAKPATNPTAIEFSEFYILGFALMRIFPGGGFRTESQGRTFDYVSTTWANMEKSGAIKSGASYVSRNNELYNEKRNKIMDDMVKIWKTRVEAERVIPLAQVEFPNYEYCAVPVMERIEYTKERVEVKRGLWFPTPGS